MRGSDLARELQSRIAPVGKEVRVIVRVDVYALDEQLVIEAELPGVMADEIDLSISETTLTIRGERPKPDDVARKYEVRERHFGRFERCVLLPCTVDRMSVVATQRDGVLVVQVPKDGRRKPRVVPIPVH